MRKFPTDALLPIGLLALNCVLKCGWCGVNELANDEPFTVFQAQRSLHALFAMLRTENNPPLFFLVTHAWSRFIGLDPALLRLPSAIFSALTVWPLFLLARKLSGRVAAITTALLFTFSDHHFGFAHEVRGYSLFVLLAVLAMWVIVRSGADNVQSEQHRSRPPATIVMLAMINTAMVYTHFFGWLMIGVEMLCVVLVTDLLITRKAFFISLVITVIAYAPYAWIFLGRMGSTVEHGTWVTVQPAEEIWNMVWRWSNAPVIAFMLLATILLAAFRRSQRDMAFVTGSIWMFVPLIGLWFVQWKVPMYVDRYLLFASPGFYLLAGHALAGLIEAPRWRWALPIGAVLGMAFTFTPWKDNGLHPSRVVAQVRAWSNDHCAVLIAPHFYDLTYAWHADSTLYNAPEKLQEVLRSRHVFAIDRANDRPLDTTYTSVVMVDAWSALTDPDGTIRNSLRRYWPVVDSINADGKVWVYRFRR